MRNEVVSNPDGSIDETKGAPHGMDILATGKGQPPPYWPATYPVESRNNMEINMHEHCRKRNGGCCCMSWRDRAILVILIRSIMAIASIIFLALTVNEMKHVFDERHETESQTTEKIVFWTLVTLIIVASIHLIAWLLGLYGAIKRLLVYVKICFITNAGLTIASFILYLASLSFDTRTIIFAVPLFVVKAVCLFVVGKYYYDAKHQQQCLQTITPSYQQRI